MSEQILFYLGMFTGTLLVPALIILLSRLLEARR
jgi:hypothetical protein